MRNPSSDPVGRCTSCGKLCFRTRKEARHHHKKAHPGEKFAVYECGPYWHYGHKPYLIQRGVTSRHDYAQEMQ